MCQVGIFLALLYYMLSALTKYQLWGVYTYVTNPPYLFCLRTLTFFI